MNIYLIRHTPVAVTESMCYGRSDVALASGWEEAFGRTLGKLPESVVASATVYSSPASRCLALAERLHGSPIVDERLREFDFGEWELTPWTDIPRDDVAAWLANLEHHPAPGGETLRAVYERSSASFEEIRGLDHEHVVVLTHGGVIRCLIAHVLGLPLAHAVRLQVDYGSVNEILVDETTARVQSVNR